MSFSPRKQHHGKYCDYARCQCGCCLCCCRWRCRHGCDAIIKFIHFYDSYCCCCCCCMFFLWRVAVQLLYRYDLQSLMGFCVSGARKIASRASEAITLAMRNGRPARLSIGFRTTVACISNSFTVISCAAASASMPRNSYELQKTTLPSCDRSRNSHNPCFCSSSSNASRALLIGVGLWPSIRQAAYCLSKSCAGFGAGPANIDWPKPDKFARGGAAPIALPKPDKFARGGTAAVAFEVVANVTTDGGSDVG